jgi:hypothetical protein
MSHHQVIASRRSVRVLATSTLLASIFVPIICFADLTGAASGYGGSQTDACNSATGIAAAQSHSNMFLETVGRTVTSKSVQVGSCTCSERQRDSNPGIEATAGPAWTCSVNWSLSISTK